jgi:hypothetical protein
MARLRSDQQQETDDCHYVVTLPTQIFLDATFAATASRGTSFVGMAEGDLSQRNRARRCSCAPTPLWTRIVHRYIRKCNNGRDRIRPNLLNDDIYRRDPALPTCIPRALASNLAVKGLPAERASCGVKTTPVKLAVHPIPGVSLRY